MNKGMVISLTIPLFAQRKYVLELTLLYFLVSIINGTSG